jgi:hypothetical protein
MLVGGVSAEKAFVIGLHGFDCAIFNGLAVGLREADSLDGVRK